MTSRDADGMWFVHGRSDDTLKIARKRTGPAEIEALLMSTALVQDAATIGVPDPIKGTAVVCLCIARPGVDQAAAIRTLSNAVTAGLGGAFLACGAGPESTTESSEPGSSDWLARSALTNKP
jgi:acetyl-CoA synthetase